MPIIDVAALKQAQEEEDARRGALLEQFKPFRDGIVFELSDFAEEASRLGFRGVKAPEAVPSTGNCVQLGFTLNSMDLLLVATDDVHSEGMFDEYLVARAFIYPKAGAPEQSPFYDAVVKETPDGNYATTVRTLASEEIRIVAVPGVPSVEAGRKAAAVVIRQLCGVSSTWRERPSLEMLLRGHDSFRVPGFGRKDA